MKTKKVRKAKDKTTKVPPETWVKNGLPVPVKEHKFWPTRRFRFDFAFVDKKLSIEIDGGVWSGGRHVRGKGFLRDQEKFNMATELGWRTLHYPPQNIDFEQIKRLLEAS